MYSSYGSYNSPPPELSNNPFLDHSSNALSRYPDIGSVPSPTNTQFTSWVGQSSGVPQQQGHYTPQPLQQQYLTGWGGSQTYQPQGPGYAYPQQVGGGSQFQPSSSFGVQLSSAMDIGGLVGQGGQGYQPQPQPQQQFASGYGTSNGYGTTVGVPGQLQVQQTSYQQPRLGNAGYLAEFDPYSAIGQGSWDGNQPQQQQQIQPQQPQQQQGGGLSNTNSSLNGQSDLHPREFIKKYKAELEVWDTYSWKQLMNSLEALRKAWERRMMELDAREKVLSRNWGAAAQQELAQCKTALKDADSSFSSVAASSYQLKEVLEGYRQSTDIASKRRVREAMNAALRSLPEYPPPNY